MTTKLSLTVEFPRLLAELRRLCNDDPTEYERASKVAPNVEPLWARLSALYGIWQERGVPVATRRGWVRADPDFRVALGDWRRKWSSAPYRNIELPDLLDDETLDPTAASQSKQRLPRLQPVVPTPPQHERLAGELEETTAWEDAENPWPHIGSWIEDSEQYLRDIGNDYVRDDDNTAGRFMAMAASLKTLGDSFGGWAAFQERVRQLEPVAVPHAIASKHSHSGVDSLLRSVEECSRAYVCGAPLAAVALARRTMEITLREHWIPECKNWLTEDLKLVNLVSSAERRFPDLIFKAEWKRAREFANQVVHGGIVEDEIFARKFRELLNLMRRMIERAPPQ